MHVESRSIAFTLALLGACGSGGSSDPLPDPIVSPPPAPAPSPTPAPPPGPKPPIPPAVVVDFSFASDTAGFQAGAADFAPGQESAVALSAALEPLPTPMAGISGYAVSASNPSSDVFTYISKRVAGLAPSQPYRVTVALRFATNAPPNCPGSPGEGVTIKAGASDQEPATVNQGGRITVNFDKGNDAVGGADAAAIGNFAQVAAVGTCAQPQYAEKTLTTPSPEPSVTSDASGVLWLVIGADSRVQGTTKIYYLGGQATFSPIQP